MVRKLQTTSIFQKDAMSVKNKPYTYQDHMESSGRRKMNERMLSFCLALGSTKEICALNS